jgi:hypothetical protein
MAASFVKKPVVIQAIRWSGENDDRVKGFVGSLEGLPELGWRRIEDRAAQVYDKLHGTWVRMAVGDWVIKGVKGEFYPCQDDVFRETYDPAPVPEA